MDSEIILAIIAPIILLPSLIGTLNYTKILGKWEGIVTTGTALAFVIGIAATIVCIGSIIRLLGGNGNFIELIISLIIAAGCIYMSVDAFSRCSTTKQKIMFPLVCWCLGMGFGFRVALKVFMNLPMSSNSSGSGLPDHFVDKDGKNYSKICELDGCRAEYECEGGRVILSEAQLKNKIMYEYEI